ncbi:MAG TPA: hypothetical protein VES42_01165, partial [Pilimelia sp.]|nr:hypothetical protein [Pilimelia sp.]
CTVRRLPGERPGETGRVDAMDPAGRYLLGTSFTGAARRQLIWADGVPGVVDDLGLSGALWAVDARGVAVGGGKDKEGRRIGLVYRDGRVDTLPGLDAVARAIGPTGLIGGGQSVRGTVQPVVWRSPDELPAELPLPAGAVGGEVVAVTPDGGIVGVVHRAARGSAAAEARAYRWAPDGSGRQLPVPTVEGEPADGFEPTGAGDGWVAGVAIVHQSGRQRDRQPHRSRGMLLDLSTGGFRALPDAEATTPVGDGVRWVGSDPARPGAAALFLPDGRRLGLPTVAGAGEHRVNAMSADGRLLAGEAREAGAAGERAHAVVWRCR